MAENKPFTIKGVLLTDIDKFKGLQEKHGFTPGKTLNFLLNDNKTEVNPVNTEGLQQKLDEITEVNRNLTEENQSLRDGLLEMPQLRGQVQDEQEKNQALTAKISELENRPEVEKKLTGTQFIFEPSEALAKKMQRAIAADRKEGKLKEVDQKEYLQWFTSRALEYFIKNEYNHLF